MKNEIADILDLSPLQSGMLFHALDGGVDPHVVQTALDVEGQLDVEVLRKAFNSLLARHEVLRARVMYRRLARPRLVILKQPRLDFAVHDLRPAAPAEQARALRELEERDR